MARAAVVLFAAAALVWPAAAGAHAERRAVGFAGAACAGAPVAPDTVLEGRFGADRTGSYVMVPFDVPRGTTQVRVKYCWDAADGGAPLGGHTLDLGLWDAPERGATWAEADFRGWGGSSHPDVQVSEQGFAPGYAPDRRANVAGFTTRGYVPGPLPAGRWAVELGVAHVVGPGDGDPDGVRWRVEIELAEDPAFAAQPYEPARFDEAPARRGAGWFAGDLHVHAEHSALGDAPMDEVFTFAFRPRAQGGAGLDFLTLSDYVTPSAWGEIGRHQAQHPGRLVMRSSEVITYRGHLNNHGSLSYVDHRTGPVLELQPDGVLRAVRAARPAREVLRAVRERGGVTQINHPTIFPSAVPAFRGFCRGCPWDHDPASTDFGLVDAIEIATGPAGLQELQVGPNPFTPLALDFYERALAAGHRIAAVGSSDAHHAGRTPNPITQSPIGQATTMVYADELSEDGVARAIRRRHTYVKLVASDGPGLVLEARPAGGDPAAPPAIMGDVVRARAATFTVGVDGGDPTFQLLVLKDGLPLAVLPVTGARFRARLPSAGEGRYRLQLQRATTIEAVSSPVWLDADAAPEDFRDGLPRGGPQAVAATVGRGGLRLRGRRPAVVRCAARGYALRTCAVRVRVRGVTLAKGRAPLRGGRSLVPLGLTRAGARHVARTRRAVLEVRALGDRGVVGPQRRRLALR
ncbi:MAG TPA: CehA/McbA family metallohydrolase [Baekduia sp.]|nr:CehA/McbA family metallohydrolase [Baekduia sp.]